MDDVSSLVDFLASDAASFITGTALAVGCGVTARWGTLKSQEVRVVLARPPITLSVKRSLRSDRLAARRRGRHVGSMSTSPDCATLLFVP